MEALLKIDRTERGALMYFVLCQSLFVLSDLIIISPYHSLRVHLSVGSVLQADRLQKADLNPALSIDLPGNEYRASQRFSQRERTAT